MSNPTALLYDGEGSLRGFAGVMIRPDEAVFSPWPAEIGYLEPFVVRVITQSGSDSDWLTPATVEYVRLEGAEESSNLAIVTFTSPTKQPVTSPPGFSPAAVVDALTGRDCQQALAHLLPELFAGFGSRPPSPADAELTPADAAAMPPATVAPSFEVVTGPPDLVQRSICKIFRWD